MGPWLCHRRRNIRHIYSIIGFRRNFIDSVRYLIFGRNANHFYHVKSFHRKLHSQKFKFLTWAPDYAIGVGTFAISQCINDECELILKNTLRYLIFVRNANPFYHVKSVHGRLHSQKFKFLKHGLLTMPSASVHSPNLFDNRFQTEFHPLSKVPHICPERKSFLPRKVLP